MKRKILIIPPLTLMLIFLDQYSKYLIEKYLNTEITFLNEFFKIVYHTNTGIAFGISVPKILLIFVSTLLILAIAYFAFKELKESPIAQILVSLILAGGIGNLLDRIFRGYVIDFISVWEWPTFNLADIYITIGVLSAVLFYGKIKRT
jgi:signal peptidase II